MSEPTPRQLFFKVFPSIALPMFMASVDSTIVATALPAIAGTLGEVERVSWVVVSYLVATTIAAPVYGRLGDALGRRRMMFGALALFVAASGACVVAPSILWLTLARVVQGLGGGGLMTLSQALVGEIIPPRERGRYQGYTASVFMTSSTFGPVAGGWLTQHLGWQSVFWINLPLGVIALILVQRLPIRSKPGGRFQFDFTGLALFSFFIAPLLLALEQARKFAWDAVPAALALFAVAVVSLRFLLRQQMLAALPLLPVSLLRQTAIWRTELMAATTGATLVPLVTFVPIYLQVVRGTTPSETGLYLVPLTMFIAVGSMMTGQIITRTGRSAIIPSIGLSMLAVVLACLAVFSPILTLSQLPFMFCAIALLNGTPMPVVQTTVQMLAGPRQLGAASASVQFSRSIGAALGTALVGAVLFGTLAAVDPATAALFGDLVESGPQALAGLPPERVAVVQEEISHAFQAAFAAIAVFSAMGACLAWSLPVRRIENRPQAPVRLDEAAEAPTPGE